MGVVFIDGSGKLFFILACYLSLQSPFKMLIHLCNMSFELSAQIVVGTQIEAQNVLCCGSGYLVLMLDSCCNHLHLIAVLVSCLSIDCFSESDVKLYQILVAVTQNIRNLHAYKPDTANWTSDWQTSNLGRFFMISPCYLERQLIMLQNLKFCLSGVRLNINAPHEIFMIRCSGWANSRIFYSSPAPLLTPLRTALYQTDNDNFDKANEEMFGYRKPLGSHKDTDNFLLVNHESFFQNILD